MCTRERNDKTHKSSLRNSNDCFQIPEFLIKYPTSKSTIMHSGLLQSKKRISTNKIHILRASCVYSIRSDSSPTLTWLMSMTALCYITIINFQVNLNIMLKSLENNFRFYAGVFNDQIL